MIERIRARIAWPSLRRRVVMGVLALLAVWFVFFDSHSLLKRVQYAQERAELVHDVQRLRETTDALEIKLDAGLTDEVVERVAREDYGMRREGEVVYPVESLGD